MPQGQVRLATSSEAFSALARDLRRAAAGQLRSQLYAGLQRSARPAIQDARASAQQLLPASGGLAARVAAASIRPRVRSSSWGAAMTITARESSTASVDLPALDRGRLRHPLYGNRGHWYTQRVPIRWFSRPMEGQAGNVERELRRSVDAVLEEIDRG